MSRRPNPRKTSADAAQSLFLKHYHAGHYDLALSTVITQMRGRKPTALMLSDAASCCLQLERWPSVIAYARQALAIDPNHLSSLHALSHAFGNLGDAAAARTYGNLALQIRDAQLPVVPPVDLPPLKSTGRRKIIAFSLFGGNSRYCEPAILNCLEQPIVYPDWTCRFYVDDTVPSIVLERIRVAGGEVVQIDGHLAAWPGTMWRFAAYDDPDASIVIFRDADSLISAREAIAVQEWLESDYAFHGMRDSGSHTEVILAGLWGVKAGALPSMVDLVEHGLSQKAYSGRFADQHFLAEYVWPYARSNILSHDSLFAFGVHRNFPGPANVGRDHVGYSEGIPIISLPTDRPDGTPVTWELYENGDNGECAVCAYPATIARGKLTTHVPARYARAIEAGKMFVRIKDERHSLSE